MTNLPLTVISQTKTTVTLGWPTVPGAEGFEYLVDGKRSNTWDGTTVKATFSNSAKSITVNALSVSAQGVYPPVTPPVSETRAVYYVGANDGTMLAALPAIKAASYNTPLIAGGWSQSIAWLKQNGMNAWVTLGNWSNTSGNWNMTQAQQISLAQTVISQLPDCWFYLADEPTVGNTSFAQTILQRQAAIQAAVPGAKCMIAYFDAGSVKIYKGIGKVAADIYPNKFNWNYSLITQLGQACTAAGIQFTTVTAAASDTQPMPTQAQFTTCMTTGLQAGSDGLAGYSWGLGLEQSLYVQAVQQIK